MLASVACEVAVMTIDRGQAGASALAVGHVCRLRLVERRRPAREEVQRLLGLRTGLSGVRQDGETGVGPELHHLERQAEISDDRVVNILDAGLVDADVVRGPSGAELLALYRGARPACGGCWHRSRPRRRKK